MTMRDSAGKLSRRLFLASSVPFTAALYSLLQKPFCLSKLDFDHGVPGRAMRAERIIFVFMSGGASHVDLFDPKPKLQEMHGMEIPPSVRRGQRLAQTAN